MKSRIGFKKTCARGHNNVLSPGSWSNKHSDVVSSIFRLNHSLHKKWGFPFRISSVNVTKSVRTADLVTFTEEILNGKPHFLCSDYRDIEYLKLKFQRSSVAYFKVDIKTHWNSVELHNTRKPLINIVDLTKVNIEINKH